MVILVCSISVSILKYFTCSTKVRNHLYTHHLYCWCIVFYRRPVEHCRITLVINASVLVSMSGFSFKMLKSFRGNQTDSVFV